MSPRPTDHHGPPGEDHRFDEQLPLSVPANLRESEATRRRIDHQRSLAKDRSFEKRLPLKGLFVLILVLAALALRIFSG